MIANVFLAICQANLEWWQIMIDGAWPPTIDQFLTDNVAFGIGYWCVFEGAAGDWLPFSTMERIIAATAVLGTFFIVYRLASWIVEIFPGKCS